MTQKSKMGVVQLTVLTFINMAGSGIIMLPSKLAQVGSISIISWLVTAIGSMSLAYVFAKCGRFSKRPGGMNGYASYAFGDSGAFMAGWTYGLSLLIANIAIAITSVGYAQAFFEVTLTPIQTCMATIGVLWLCTAANFGGAKVTGQIGTFTVWGVILPVCSLGIVGWFWFSPEMYVNSWNPHSLPFGEAVSASIAMTLWAFLGLESACANSDSVENPEKNVPIAVLGGTLIAALVYIISTNICAGIVENGALAASTAPFSLVWQVMLGTWAGKAVAGLAVIACTGSLLGWQFTIASVFKSSADESFFPKVFSEVDKRGTPIKGMIIITVIQTALSLMTISPTLNEQFESLVNLAVVTNVVPYILCMAAIFIMQKFAHVDKKEMSKTNFIAVVAAVYSFYALYGSGYEAMMWGSIVTFFGWTMYGFIADKHEDVEMEKAR
ncbi:putrescine-ornithine antiporter [Aliivibrio fischeri]|uniref:Putrescine transporter PotE n=1 Tax=Aliivibrio fischeri TaxID=668 RepID=A0A510UCQ5_ALIFS|nr:putrescine-ornithine antiporter [Aliivibrio fischeri]MUI54751.1 putrescine-ornithine antiporter [Aliivibrio fischeri]MUJ36777.1 putrescine-ornithine antiporter [Aliivibrio fischeri]MUK29122.1 putrescine-ornithine antiporter [Aliivibrio fischeri]MUK51475.1 putrescine-ornithine antiporter [Aliivibrio fischeri]MUK64201.1 putrescine-ornithine antiporter [Aliivibrio fischeri]